MPVLKNKEVCQNILTSRIYKPYVAYCNSKRVATKDRLKLADLVKVVSAIFLEISTNIIGKKGGVYIKNFGYWFVLVSQGHKALRIGDKKIARVFTPGAKSIRVRPIFVPLGPDRRLTYWSMDGQFSKRMFKSIDEKVKDGFEYKAYFNTLKEMQKQ